jgi:hypothetical protein
MDRKEFLKCTFKGAASLMALPCCLGQLQAAEEKPAGPAASCDAASLRDWLTQFIQREETQLGRPALIKLLEERGRACCSALDFRQNLIKDSQGSGEKLVELMGKIVGPENCRQEGNTVNLIYPVNHCVCGSNPKRPAAPDDPYCDCSKANNQKIFEIVTGKPVRVEVAESVRRGGAQCRFIIHLG